VKWAVCEGSEQQRVAVSVSKECRILLLMTGIPEYSNNKMRGEKRKRGKEVDKDRKHG
jgi:hypothetical protein